MEHKTLIKVRGYHLDIYGHVNNARYLEFLEEARWSFFEQYGAIEAFADMKLAFVLVNVNINYRRSALPDEVIEIRTQINRIGNKSCTFYQEIVLANKPDDPGEKVVIADADVTFCFMDMESHKSVVIDDTIREKIEKMM